MKSSFCSLFQMLVVREMGTFSRCFVHTPLADSQDNLEIKSSVHMEIECSQNGLEGICTQNGHIKDLTAAQTGQPNTTKWCWGRACIHSEVTHVTSTQRHLTSRSREPCRRLCHTAGELTSPTGGEQLEKLYCQRGMPLASGCSVGEL